MLNRVHKKHPIFVKSEKLIRKNDRPIINEFAPDIDITGESHF